MGKLKSLQVDHDDLERRIKAAEDRGVAVSPAAYKALQALRVRVGKAQRRAAVRVTQPVSRWQGQRLELASGRKLQLVISPENLQRTGWLEVRTHADGGGDVRRQAYSVVEGRWAENPTTPLTTAEQRHAERVIRDMGFAWREPS